MIVVDRIRATGLDEAMALHSDSTGDFIVPIDRERFEVMVSNGQWTGGRSGGRLVAIAYVTVDRRGGPDEPQWELGGVYCEPAIRGRGIAERVAQEAVATAQRSAPDRRVVSYVHNRNHGAIRTVLGRLGFFRTERTVVVEPDELLGALLRDEQGRATADVFELPTG